jgi:uncharacterized membrane protein
MDSVAAAHLLEQVDAVHERTRTLVRSLWYPFAVWGAIAAVGALAALAVPDQQGWYWIVTSGVGMGATTLYYRRRAQRIGAVTEAGHPMVVGVVLCVVVLAVSAALPAVATPWIAVGLIYQLLARVVCSKTVSAAGWLLIAVAVAAQLTASGRAADSAANAVCGIVLVGTALLLRSQEQAALRGLTLELAQ